MFLLSFPIAIFVNVIRVSGTAILADYDPQIAMGFYHSFSSWLIFLLGIAFVSAASYLLHRFLDRAQ